MLSIYAELAGFLDLSSDMVLLIAVVRAGRECVDSHDSVEQASRECSDYTILTVVISFSVIAPYLIAFSSGVHILKGKGLFNPRAANGQMKPLWRRCLTALYATPFGPLYFVSV